jgi:hypothetical protein
MKNNEQGSTLLILLLIMTLILIIGLALLGNTISSAKQTNKTEKHMQATHLAEMGVIHLQERLNHLTKDELKTLNQDTIQPLLENISKTITSPHLPVDEKNYHVTNVRVTHTNDTSTALFLVEGIAYKESVTLQPSFTLTYQKNYNSVLDIQNNLQPKELTKPYDTINNDYSISMNETEEFGNVYFNKRISLGSKSTLLTKDVKFTDDVSMNKYSTLHIQGDGQFQGLDGVSGSKIIVDGNAFFTERFILTRDISLLHIKGNTKFHNGFELTAGPTATINGSMYFDARGQNLQVESGGVLTIDGDLFIRMENFTQWFLDLRGTIIVKGNIYMAMKRKNAKEDVVRDISQELKESVKVKIGDNEVTAGIPNRLEDGKIHIGQQGTVSNWSATLDTVEY